MGELVRLQRYLASAGVAARRKAEQLITAGRVTVNGEVVTTLGTKVDPDTAEVTVDGEAVMAKDAFYVLLNKPKACITAVTDDRGRPTVMDYLPNVPVPVKPVGRLDFYSEGVLLLTNDGELAAKLLAPASHVAKTYHVKVHGQLSADHVKQLRDGITLDDGTTTMPAEISVLPGESKHTWLGITIHEGKHRQIHRMIEALGYQVDKLQRVAFANLTFHDLRVGDARELNQTELNALRDLVGLDHSTVARGRWRSEREDTDVPRRARAKAREEAEAEAAENEANRERNALARAASGDAWDGEGDPDRNPDGVEPSVVSPDEDDTRGAPMPAAKPPAPRARGAGGAGKPYESRAVGRRDPDDPRAARGGPRIDDRPPAPHGGPRGARDDRGGGGARGGAPRSGGREVRQYSDRTPSTRTGGGDRADSASSDRGGARSYAPRSEGARGASSDRGGARSYAPRGEGARGPRSDGPRGASSDRGGARSYAPRGEGGRGPRSEGPRGASSDRGGARSYAPRGEGARGPRSESPRGARSESPRGARSESPRGARSDGPRGAGSRSFGQRGAAPRARAGGDAPRDKGRWRDREAGPRSRDEVAFGPQEPDQKPRGAGARAPGPSGAKRTGQGRSYGSKPGGKPPRR